MLAGIARFFFPIICTCICNFHNLSARSLFELSRCFIFKWQTQRMLRIWYFNDVGVPFAVLVIGKVPWKFNVLVMWSIILGEDSKEQIQLVLFLNTCLRKTHLWYIQLSWLTKIGRLLAGSQVSAYWLEGLGVQVTYQITILCGFKLIFRQYGLLITLSSRLIEVVLSS